MAIKLSNAYQRYQRGEISKQEAISLIKQDIAKVKSAIESAKSELQRHLSSQVNFSDSIISGIQTSVRNAVSTPAVMSGSILENIKNTVSSFLSAGVEKTRDIISDIKDKIRGGVERGVDITSTIISNIKTTIYDNIKKGLDALTGKIQDTYSFVKEHLEQGLKAVEEKLKEIPIDISYFVSALLGGVIEMVSILKDLPKKIKEEIDDLMTIDEEKLIETMEKLKQSYRNYITKTKF